MSDRTYCVKAYLVGLNLPHGMEYPDNRQSVELNKIIAHIETSSAVWVICLARNTMLSILIEGYTINRDNFGYNNFGHINFLSL
jgi:hypothetical protein